MTADQRRCAAVVRPIRTRSARARLASPIRLADLAGHAGRAEANGVHRASPAEVWCQGYSEPGAGSDLASLATAGRVEDDPIVVNGQKIWTSTAHVPQMMFALVRTEPDAKKHAGLSYLLIPMDMPGIEVRPLRTMTGHAEFNEPAQNFRPSRFSCPQPTQRIACLLSQG